MHGFETQQELMYNAQHAHVIINGAWLQRKQPHPRSVLQFYSIYSPHP